MLLKRPGLAILTLTACGLVPLAAHGHEASSSDPTDPHAPVTRTHYHPIMNDYRPSAIMERPQDWRELNERAERIGGPLGQLRKVDEPIRKRKRN